MIADATGHGISSALITASARSCFSVMNKLAEEDPDFTFSPGAMLSYANRVVSEAASGQIMMTFFSCVLDFDAHTLTYASAGHNPPWLFSKSGNSFRLNSLTPDGVRLGESLDVDPYPEKTLPISSGDLLFLYTDGLTEGMNVKGEQFGKKRVKQCVQDSLTLGPQGMIDSIMDQFLAHNSGKSLDDDVTVAAARIL
jgi:sigma-B regulation protein RsbU (phosphoserine phosphatase)